MARRVELTVLFPEVSSKIEITGFDPLSRIDQSSAASFL